MESEIHKTHFRSTCDRKMGKRGVPKRHPEKGMKSGA